MTALRREIERLIRLWRMCATPQKITVLIVKIIILLFTVVAVSTAQEPLGSQLVIANVRVFTGERSIENATIIAENGEVVSIAVGDTTADTLVIDGTGMTALPGLIDAHVHLLVLRMGEAETLAFMEGELQNRLQSYLRHGVTTVKSTGDPTGLVLRTRRELREGTLTGPRLLVVGPLFTAPGGHPAATICGANDWCRANVTFETDSEEQARREVVRLARLGIDAIKLVYQGGERFGIQLVKLQPEVMRAIVQEAREQGLPVTAHVGDEPSALEALEAGVEGLEHGPVGPLTSPAVARALMNPVRSLVPTLAIRRARSPDFQAAARTVAELHEAGIRFVLGSDTDTFASMSPGEMTIQEIEALVDAGLSPEEALEAATSVAARHLGLENAIGKLQPGMTADILLVRGNPLQRISDLRQVEVVIQAGEIVFRPDQ